LKGLIIVESPTKARTIGQFLGRDYQVLSSQGHVRDLPRNGLGVDIDKGFVPQFETKRSKLVTALHEAAKKADRVYLATDHDREGEAIAYDLYTILKKDVKDDDAFLRPVFDEITKPVILEALRHPARIDVNKVEAQRTRRILDRLVGYLVSPLLSKSLAGTRFEGLSAGRVQSVALRVLCDREEEIARFTAEEYWEISALLRDGEPFSASLTKRDGKKLVVRSQEESEAVASDLRRQAFHVESLTEKERLRQPPPPFITSSLQQAASSALGFSPKRTMQVAQELYEGVSLPEGNAGLITYMRTDSVRLSDAAVREARDVVGERFGERYVAGSVRQYKNQKRSQDAHEAIRPTDPRRAPEEVADDLTPDQRRLYALIYRRFLATQMASAVYRQRKAVVAAGPYTLEVSGSLLLFDGFLALAPEEEREAERVPAWLREGERLVLADVKREQKFTEPPRRYSEAGLVNLLEKLGVGRPSTYATILSVIQERGYVLREKGSLRPTLLGQMVVGFLKRHFADTVEAEFTAHLEEELDRIEEGEISRLDALRGFYGPFSEQVGTVERLVSDSTKRPFRVLTDVPCDKCGGPMELRYWKGSHFLGCSAYPECRNTRNLAPDVPYRYDGETLVLREALEARSSDTAETSCAVCGSPMALKEGRYGRYLQCTSPDCKKTTSISTGVACPACGEGVLVEKYSQKRRRTFYSCNRYPDCRFAVSEKPVKICPTCGSGVMTERESGLRCNGKSCGYEEKPAEAGA
jgi:DNA topoisomerase-1